MATRTLTSASPLRVLISGAGIAGPCLAWFLTQPSLATPVHVTIVERSPNLRSGGQNIDIRGKAIDVVRRMGLLDAVRARNSTEEGLSFVDGRNRSRALFPVEKGSGSFTAEFEIVRADLCEVLYEASLAEREDKVTYLFNESIKAITEPEGADAFEQGARVEFTNGTPAAEFDVVVGADGLGSKVRRLVWPEAGRDVFKSLGQIMAFFTIPRGETDSKIARWFSAPGRRVEFVRYGSQNGAFGGCSTDKIIRPDNHGKTRALLGIVTEDPRVREALASGTGRLYEDSVKKQKALLRELFADAGWESERILDGMDKADDFYMSEIAQIKMDKHGWSKGHAVLLGDAGKPSSHYSVADTQVNPTGTGYCPSPISGQGTSLALIGSYVLAGEILKHGRDVRGAFKGYDTTMRPMVQKAQKLFPGAPAIAHPETRWGISVFWAVLKTLTVLKSASNLVPSGDSKEVIEKVPDYEGLPRAAVAV